MLEQLKAMEAAGQWMEIRQIDVTTLTGLDGDQLARAYLATSKAWELTATTADEYRTALAHAKTGLSVATVGGLMHTWLLARVAAYSADLGDYRTAEITATAFLKAQGAHPSASSIAPWASYALGRTRATQRRFPEAIAIYEQTKSASAGEFAERIQLAIVWALAQAGRVSAAVAACPARLEHLPDAYLQAASAIILAKSGDWQGARLAAKTAIHAYTTAPVYDLVEAAELVLILRHAATALGDTDGTASWASHIAAPLCRGTAGITNALLPTLRPEGGAEFEHAAVSRCGSAGDQRRGLLGVVG